MKKFDISAITQDTLTSWYEKGPHAGMKCGLVYAVFRDDEQPEAGAVFDLCWWCPVPSHDRGHVRGPGWLGVQVSSRSDGYEGILQLEKVLGGPVHVMHIGKPRHRFKATSSAMLKKIAHLVRKAGEAT